MKLKKTFIYSSIVLIVLFLAVVVLAGRSIFTDVREIATEASSEFQGDYVEALIAYVQSPTHSYKQKNRAIWALGEIGDPRALPVLEELYTSKSCPKPCDPYSHLCQYGLQKAVKFCKGNNIVAAPLQRYLGLKN